MDRVQDQTNIDKTPGPELMSGIRDRCPKTHLAGCILHRVVEEGELTRYHFTLRIGKTNFGFETTGAHLLLHCGETVLRNGEVGVNGIEPFYDQQGVTGGAV